MIFKRIIGGLFSGFERLKRWSQDEEIVYSEPEEETGKEVRSLWDFLAFKENTQAFHLVNVIGFDEWADMEEIRRRIKEIFSIEYKNEKSLYPYLKTLTDIHLIESTNIGGRRKWRKKGLLFEIENEKGKADKKEKAKIKVRSKEN